MSKKLSLGGATPQKIDVPQRKLSKVSFTTSDQGWSQLSMFLYGPPGSGKTHFAGTAVEVPEMREVLFCDNDGGTRTLQGKSRFPGIKIALFQDYPSYNPFINWLIGGRGPGVEVFQANLGDPLQYKTIVIDNLGKLHQYIIDHILATTEFKRFHKDLPAQTDFRLAIVWMNQLFDTLAEHSRRHEVSIILTAHVKVDIDEDTGRILSRAPLIPGKLASIIPGDMPLVGYLSAEGKRTQLGAPSTGSKEVIYTANFKPFDRYTLVKDQSDKLGEMTDPSMSKLYNIINSK